MRQLTVEAQEFPIAGSFRISRETRTVARVVCATITDGTVTGRGEGVPYPRYGESVEGVMADIEAMADAVAGGLDPDGLRSAMKHGAARNAIDGALIDLACKSKGVRAAELLGIDAKPVTTAFTLSIGEPAEMAEAAANAAHRPLLKVKLGLKEGDRERIAAVRGAAPKATIIIDANEGWGPDQLVANMEACAAAGVSLIEQPMPADADQMLAEVAHPVPICADESVHDAKDLAALKGRYDAINIKLDKAGGLTEALVMHEAARTLGFKVMIGCMVGTSLGMAPAIFAAQGADFVDLDGPLLLAEDRTPGLTYDGSVVHPPEPALWG
ncbi:MAG: N-acetyl-D-Glu racemase DgcA [Pseudomonadota bacterium]